MACTPCPSSHFDANDSKPSRLVQLHGQLTLATGEHVHRAALEQSAVVECLSAVTFNTERDQKQTQAQRGVTTTTTGTPPRIGCYCKHMVVAVFCLVLFHYLGSGSDIKAAQGNVLYWQHQDGTRTSCLVLCWCPVITLLDISYGPLSSGCWVLMCWESQSLFVHPNLLFLKLQVYYPDVLDDFLQRTIWEVTFGNCLTWQVIGWAISLPLRLISTNPISSWRALLPVEMVGQSNSDGSHSREEGNIFSTEPSVLLTYIYIYIYTYILNSYCRCYSNTSSHCCCKWIAASLVVRHN